MFTIVSKKELAQDTVLMDVEAPRLAQSALPGQFLIVKMAENSERIPLTISDYDIEKGTVTIVFKIIGESTRKMAEYNVGDSFRDVVGPLGKPSEFVHLPEAELKSKKFAFIGGGVGIAPIYPQVKWLSNKGVEVNCIIGARTRSLLVFEEELRSVCNLYVTTDDGSSEYKGLVTDVLRTLIDGGKHYDEVVAIGPMIMMKFVTLTARKFDLPCIVSLNALMVDGTGMCGACRVKIAGKTKFTCVDGPEFNAYDVDFDEAMRRQSMYRDQEQRALAIAREREAGHKCNIGLDK